MKRIVIIILILGFQTRSGFPQLTYEGKYDNNLQSIQLEDGAVKYLKVNTNTNQLTIYNIDHTIWKEIKLEIPENHFLDEVKLVSQRIFDQDDQIEVLYTFYSVENSNRLENPLGIYSNYLYTMKMVNEDGKEILNVSNAMDYKLVQQNDIRKLLIFTIEDGGFNSSNYTLVYTLK